MALDFSHTSRSTRRRGAATNPLCRGHADAAPPAPASLLIPLSFAAAILKYRLMNIDIIIKTTCCTDAHGTLIFIYLFSLPGGGRGILLVAWRASRDKT